MRAHLKDWMGGGRAQRERERDAISLEVLDTLSTLRGGLVMVTSICHYYFLNCLQLPISFLLFSFHSIETV